MADVDRTKPWVFILAGGSGRRFWPASRRETPKHLLPLGPDGGTLLRATVQRALGITIKDRVLVITAADQAAAVLADVGDLIIRDNLLAEPVPRNTAPAIALGIVTVALRGAGPHEPIIVLPSDHGLTDLEAWEASLRRAVDAASEHKTIVTLGVEPTFASTGFGYLGLGGEEETAGDSDVPVRKVLQFREKPSVELAEDYFAAKGSWWWNAGIFVFRLGYLWYVMGDLREDLDLGMQLLSACIQQGDQAALAEEYAKLESISVDYAVMEQAPSLMSVPLDCGWSDLGSWDALEGLAQAEEVVAVGSSDNVVYAPGKTVALVGVSDLVLVATDDAILVMPRERAQEVKDVTDELAERGRDELL
ncbi:MAG: NTP transferase domain-containing protein [Proteobacteria bacterium]|nr:NTP transferase domain-containing protein [Pseudomonadota bacterium]